MGRTPAKPETTFGALLRKAREARGLTQAELAELSGISQKSITHYELHATRPNVKVVTALARALGIAVDTLLETETHSGDARPCDIKFRRKLHEAEALPEDDRKMVVQLIDHLTTHSRRSSQTAYALAAVR